MKSLPQETPEFSGKAVIALATDPQRAKKTGKAILAADVGVDYKFKDIDGGLIDNVNKKFDFLFYCLLKKMVCSSDDISLQHFLFLQNVRNVSFSGSEPGSLRAVKSWFSATGYQTLAYYTPSWLRVPTWVMTFLSSRLQ